ncbi:MAG: HAMP domain-containing sensor histidine kinase [Candidatus Omnitrophota bacterium]
MRRSNRLIHRTFWFIRLRWVAIGGVTVTILFADRVLGVKLPLVPLFSVTIFLALYNTLFLVYLKRIHKKISRELIEKDNLIANAQISLDLLCLTALIHFSGGIENPFIFYFIFHMIIAGILLRRRTAFMQATFAVFLFCSLVILEYFKLLPHYPLEGFITKDVYNNPIHIAGISFVFISTLYIAVYMATEVAKLLRKREESLRQANELLREKDRAKSEYVLRATHNIKEHLAAIQGCIEPVTHGFTGDLNRRQKDLLERANKRTGKLLFFVRALLEITNIKLSEHIKMEPFSVKSMLASSITSVEARAKSKDIKLETKFDSMRCSVTGTRLYVEETVTNLLMNAVKYTPRGGEITLEAIEESGSVLITVRDTGIGIPGDELAKVFEEFYRASNAQKTERDGTGLGLSIAKQVVERHNGKIWVESEEGKGSSFYISLPK